MDKPIKKILVTDEGKFFYIRDDKVDFHCQYGCVKAADIKSSGSVETNRGKKLYVFSPTFFDKYLKIKRSPQIIPRKDVGLIVAECGLGKDSVVVDAGSGSGAVACMLGNIVKTVHTYDVREDHIAIVERNLANLGLKNVTVKKHDIYTGIPQKGVDAVVLDLPEPWKCLDPAVASLAVGGFLVAYVPTIPQVMDFVSAVKADDRFLFLKTVELIEREWEVDARKVRPKSRMIGHSGFLTFCRRKG